MNTWKCSILSATIVALSTGWAAAAPAVVLDYLNLRVGPGYGYGIIEVIPIGWTVDAGACGDGWCQVNVDGIAGYVDANYLGIASPPAIAYGPPPYYWSRGPYDGRYAYDDGYDDDSLSPGTFAGAYAQQRNAGMRIDRKVAAPVRSAAPARSTAVAKDKTTPHGAKVASSISTTGAATNALRPSRADPIPPR